MDIRSELDEDEAKDMNLEFELSDPDPSNATDFSKTALIVKHNDESEAVEKLLKEYCGAKIDNNNPDFPRIRDTLKE